MPFPSGRCQTCRARHLKCDERRPTCSTCERSNRDCTWDDQDIADLLFRNENAFASNRARRQRGGARRRAQRKIGSSTPSTRTSLEPLLRLTRSTSQSPDKLDLEYGLTLYRPGEKLIDHARTKTFQFYIHHDGDFSSDIWGFLNKHRHNFFPTGNHEFFSVAFDSFALVYYGLSSEAQEAILAGRRAYAQALRKTRETMSGGQDLYEDQVVLAIMLLASTEDMMGDTDNNSVQPPGYSHLKGVLALIELRQQFEKQSLRSMEVDHIAQRRFVRQAVYGGQAIPASLKAITTNGKPAINLGLDIYMTEVADLRNHAKDALTHFYKSPADKQRHQSIGIIGILKQASEIDRKLAIWHRSLPKEWSYNVDILQDAQYEALKSSGVFYDKTIGDYSRTELDVAVLLNRYRAARIICLGFITRLLTEATTGLGPNPEQAGLWNIAQELAAPLTPQALLENATSTVQGLISEIIQSIPSIFCHPVSPVRVTSISTFQRTPASKMLTLIWPLIVVSSVLYCPRPERTFVKSVLLLISKTTGSVSLRRVANYDTHLINNTGMATLSVNDKT